MLKILFYIFSAAVLLSAETSTSKLKEMVKQNPSLLETPQAKAAMAEKGVSAQEVRDKINNTKNTSVEKKDNNESIKNNIAEIEQKTQEQDKKVESQSNKFDPFKYKTSEEINKYISSLSYITKNSKLKRYSSRFYANSNKIDSSSLPTPDNYVVSSGDNIVIQLYGDRNKEYSLLVTKNGTVNIEFIGPIKVAGNSFSEVKKILTKKLKEHYKTSKVTVSMNKYSSIQVSLVGDVDYPGLYNISSFSSVKDLLVVAKGVSNTGSVRTISIKRDNKTVSKIDLYELLFNGKNSEQTLLKHGDVVMVSKADTLVSIDGFVNNSAIFELKEGESLSDLIAYAGGMKPSASKKNIKIQRYVDNKEKVTFNVKYKDSSSFTLLNGDVVYIYPIDSFAKTSINIYGNIIRPGSYDIHDASTLNDLLKKLLKDGYKSFFLPDTYFDYALVKRYNEQLEHETFSFSLKDVINNKTTIALAPNDQVYIFNKNNIFTNSYITTTGDVLAQAGDFQYYSGMTIRDAVNASKIDGIIDDKISLTRYSTPNNIPKTTIYSLSKQGDFKLKPYDKIEVFDFYKANQLHYVHITGEVLRPDKYFYENGMSLKKLIENSGGFTNKAYKDKVEILRHELNEKNERVSKVISIDLQGKKLEDIYIEPYDIVKIFKVPNWNEARTITIKGEVKFPGVYAFDSGDKISDVIERAGGFTNEAFIEGAVFTRESIKEQQIKNYKKNLSDIRRALTVYASMPANSAKSQGLNNAQQSLVAIMEEAKNYQPIGRIRVDLKRNIEALRNSEYDIKLKDKDSLIIPSKTNTVTVFGEVFNPSSFVYDSKLDSSGYIKMASGTTRSADDERIYVIHSDGSSEPIGTCWFSSGIDISPGDTIVVPLYIKEYEQIEVWNSVSKILSSFALTAAAINSIGMF